MNRIQDAIERMDKRLETRTAEQLEILEAQVNDTKFRDLCRYQDVRAAAHAGGTLTLEEATLGYKILGGEMPSEAKWRARTLAEKMVMTQMAWELQK